MRKTDLIEGHRYILTDKLGVGVYKGPHDGVLTLEDGTKFYGGNGHLMFRLPDDGDRLVLLPSGADVHESEAAKLERERRTEEARETQRTRVADVMRFLASFGITNDPDMKHYDPRYLSADAFGVTEVDDVVVKGLTFGHLRRIAAGS